MPSPGRGVCSQTAFLNEARPDRRLTAFPLAIPLMAGPGFTATLLIAGRANGSTAHLLMLLGVIVAVVTLCFAISARSDDAIRTELVWRQ
jgi:small neutral amino acid transporter SnatA (MarC family)